MKNFLVTLVLAVLTFVISGSTSTTNVGSWTATDAEAITSPPPITPLTMCEAPISCLTSEQYPDPIGVKLTITDLVEQTECEVRDLVINPENGAESYVIQNGHTYQITLQLYSDDSGSTIKDLQLHTTWEENVSPNNVATLMFLAVDSNNSQPLMGARMLFSASEDLDLIYVEHSAKRSPKSTVTDGLYEMSTTEVDNFFNSQQGIFLGDLYGLSTYKTIDQAATVTFSFQAVKE